MEWIATKVRKVEKIELRRVGQNRPATVKLSIQDSRY